MWSGILIGGFLISHGLVHLTLKTNNSWLTGVLGLSDAALAAAGKTTGQVALWTFLLVGLGVFGVPLLNGWIMKGLVVVGSAASLVFSAIAVNNPWIVAPVAINLGAVLYVYRWR